jgi:hypothetical protein
MIAIEVSEAVSFEIPDLATAARLAKRLAGRWMIDLVAESDELMLLVAELRPRSGDLAALLREVEAWVAEETLCAVRFEVDGRSYVLEAGEANWDSPPWKRVDTETRKAQLLEALTSVETTIAEVKEREGPGSDARVLGLTGLRDDIALALRLLD